MDAKKAAKAGERKNATPTQSTLRKPTSANTHTAENPLTVALRTQTRTRNPEQRDRRTMLMTSRWRARRDVGHIVLVSASMPTPSSSVNHDHARRIGEYQHCGGAG
jgi:hypothetical protein